MTRWQLQLICEWDIVLKKLIAQTNRNLHLWWAACFAYSSSWYLEVLPLPPPFPPGNVRTRCSLSTLPADHQAEEWKQSEYCQTFKQHIYRQLSFSVSVIYSSNTYDWTCNGWAAFDVIMKIIYLNIILINNVQIISVIKYVYNFWKIY